MRCLFAVKLDAGRLQGYGLGMDVMSILWFCVLNDLFALHGGPQFVV